MNDRPSYKELEKKFKDLEQEYLLTKETARESEERYQAFFERSFDIIYIHDFEGRFLDLSNSALTMLGYSRDEVPNLTLRTLLTDDQMHIGLNIVKELRETGSQKGSSEYMVRRKDGGFLWLETRSSVIYRGGEPYAIQGVARDITDRKVAQEQLRKIGERYRIIFENTGNASILVGEDTTILLANSNFEKLSGYSRQEIEGKMSWTVFIADEDLEMMKRYHVQRRIDPNSAPSFYEFRFKNRFGEMKDIFLTLALIPGTNESVASCMDITEHKRAEEAMCESEERYRSILDNMEEVYYEVDLKGNFTFFNSRAVNRLGYTINELNGMNFRNYMDDENARKVFNAYHSVFLSGKPITGVDWELKDKSGRGIFAEASVSLMRNADGDPTGFRGVVRDITERKRAEEALRESEEKYRTILENMEEAYFELDLDGCFAFFNDSLSKVLDYSRQELMGMHYKVYSTPEAAGKASQIFDEILRAGISKTMVDYEIIRKDGDKRVIEASISLMNGPLGKAIGFCGIGRDITERIHAEQAIKESERRYRLLAENLRDVIWVLDTDLHYVYVSPSVMELRGYTPEEVMKHTMDHTLTPESYQKVVDIFTQERLLEFGGQMHGKEWTKNIELEMIRKDGSTVWTEVKINILYDEAGNPTGILGTTRDISERKKVEKALRESEERWQFALEGAGDGVWDFDIPGSKVYRSRRWKEMLGYAENDISDSPDGWANLVHPDDRQQADETLIRHLKGEKPIYTSEHRVKCKDGTYKWILERGKVIRWSEDGRPLRIIGTQTDITEKKNLEQQLMRAQKMEAVGTLAGGIAHDFNNLLMGILGNVSLMLMNCDESHPFFDRLKSVEEYVQRGSDLSKQLLGFARGGKYEVKPTHLGEFIRKSSEMFGRTKKEIRIHRKVAKGLWAVEVDRGQMEQVLLNLFVNAWQAMPGGGDMYLSVENIDLDAVDVSPFDIKPGRFVKVTVTDTGIGMDESVKSRIFEPFFTTKERGRGTGLGLASVYGIIKNHGGFIHVESEKDLGTSFMIYLPASEKYVQDELGTKDEIMKGQEAVLLIDDEEMILDVGSKMLESLGYKVMTAPGGRQGLLIYEQNKDKIDLVVLDIIMPDFGGRETFDTLRRIDPAVRVLLSSGYSLDGQAKEIMQSGCKGFIQKPFSMAELSKKIREILDSDQLCVTSDQ